MAAKVEIFIWREKRNPCLASDSRYSCNLRLNKQKTGVANSISSNISFFFFLYKINPLPTFCLFVLLLLFYIIMRRWWRRDVDEKARRGTFETWTISSPSLSSSGPSDATLFCTLLTKSLSLSSSTLRRPINLFSGDRIFFSHGDYYQGRCGCCGYGGGVF